MSKNKATDQIYDFGPFRLNAKERTLLRAGQPVKLTPKAIDTLLVLVEHNGHIVAKDDLMEAVWPGTFVEESNLASNVSLLRKALGESDGGASYIQTVPRRGYRFVAVVTEQFADEVDLLVHRRTRARFIKHEEEFETVDKTIAVKPLQPGGSTENFTAERASWVERRRRVATLSVVGLVAISMTGIAILVIFRQRPKPFTQVRVTRLTASGMASLAAISPDGKYVAHALGGRGQQSLWLRHIATGSDKEIVAASQGDYNAITFSPDGNYIYFLRWETVESELYRVAFLGGPAQRLGSDIDGDISFSPDGNRIAFMHGYPQKDEAAIAIANADGANEQILITKKGQGNMFGTAFGRAWGPAWSTDGEVIAFPLRRAEGSEKYWNVSLVRVKDHSEQQLSHQPWSGLGQFSWMADGRGLIVAAADKESQPAQQLWFVSYPSGDSRRITNDANNYNGVSLTADGRNLVTVQTAATSNIWVAPENDSAQARQITANRSDGAQGLAWMADGRIVFTRREQGLSDIWIVNADGTAPKQLTINARNNIRPAVSPDQRYIVFSSNRTGKSCIWRIGIDGSNPKQLTTEGAQASPQISADGDWVIFSDFDQLKEGLWKISIEGGSATRLTDYKTWDPVISGDGNQIAASFIDETANPKRWRFTVVPVAGGRPGKILDLDNPLGANVRWTSDGGALAYLQTRDGVSNIWTQPLAGGPARKLTDFKSDQIFSYAWSEGGRQLALARGIEIRDVVLINELR